MLKSIPDAVFKGAGFFVSSDTAPRGYNMSSFVGAVEHCLNKSKGSMNSVYRCN